VVEQREEPTNKRHTKNKEREEESETRRAVSPSIVDNNVPGGSLATHRVLNIGGGRASGGSWQGGE
jgi:hypothetical protein